MQIVLPGALPDSNAARELIPYLLKTAPTLVAWLQNSRASVRAADPVSTGCTPYEQWLLEQNGFQAHAGQNLNAGLGPLWADKVTKRDQPIWLAELVHVSPSRDGAALLPASELHITPEQSAALFESAQNLFEGSGFTFYPTGTERWTLEPTAGFAPHCASPDLVSISTVNDWWPQDIEARPWRRLVNELQMLWFDHPVNQARYKLGQVPINSLWLFGGASADQLKNPSGHGDVQVFNTLSAHSLAQDWGGWIAALGDLENTVFKPLAQRQPAPELVLLGREKFVEIKPSALRKWTQWLPGSRDTWRKWWSPQN